MKNRNCLVKDACRSYNASNCEVCAIGEKFSCLMRQIKKLKAEKKEAEHRAEVAEHRAEVADRAARWLALSEFEYDDAIANAKYELDLMRRK